MNQSLSGDVYPWISKRLQKIFEEYGQYPQYKGATQESERVFISMLQTINIDWSRCWCELPEHIKKSHLTSVFYIKNKSLKNVSVFPVE